VVEKDLLMTYETDSSTKPIHGKAVDRLFERKQMTKSFRKIAVVAAAALTLGGLTGVAAHATAALAQLNGSTAATASPTVGTYQSVTLQFETETAKVASISSTGVGSIAVPSINPTGSAGLYTTGITSSGATVFGTATANDVPGTTNNTALNLYSLNFSAYSATAGTQTITVTDATGSSTFTLTWGAAPAFSAQYSTTQIVGAAGSLNPGSGATSNEYVGTNATVSSSATAGHLAAVIGVAIASGNNTAFSAPLTASISGAGLVSITNDGALATTASTGIVAAQGTAVTSATNSSYYRVAVYSDGRSGSATITLASGTTTFATKTVTFYGAYKNVSATQALFVAKAGSALGIATGSAVTMAAPGATNVASTAAITALVTDANNNAATGLVWGTDIKAVTSNSAVITVGTGSEDAATPGTWYIQVSGANGAISGQSATVTVELYNSTTSAWDVLAKPLTFSVGGAISKITAAFDNTSYNPGAPVVLTYTATDSASNKAYDQDAASLTSGAFLSSLTSSVYLGAALTSPASLINGVTTYKGYAPAIEGDFKVSGTDAASTAAEAVSASATVGASAASQASQAAIDAANNATDAANAAYDAANNAMDSADAAQQSAQDASDNAAQALAAVTALSNTVAKLVSQIAAIAAVVAKIQKKIGA